MALIIGSNGFIGKNLIEHHPSVEILDRFVYQLEAPVITDTLYITAPTANKWIVNADPEADKIEILKLAQAINKNIKAKTIILFSTIDVYEDISNSDELSQTQSKVSYGGNRRFFEECLRENKSDLFTFRFSGLFGKFLKKNIIYDLCKERDDEVSKYNLDSEFQFIEITHALKLMDNLVRQTPSIYNFSSPPISVADLVTRFGWKKSKILNNLNIPLVKYDVKTIKNKSYQYMFDSEEIAIQLEQFRFSNGI